MEEAEQAAVRTVESGMDFRTTSDSPYKGCTWGQLQDALVEKEYQLECARDSIGQLSACKAESLRKDSIITSLRKELTVYKKNSWSKDFRYTSLKERLDACESDLQEKTDKVKVLQKELKETRDQLKAKGYGSSAPHTQKKSGTSTTVSQTEVAQLDSLKQELAKKRSDLSLLQERIKKLRNTNQDLQKRLEESQSQQDNLSKVEQRLKAEVVELKTHSSDSKLLQAKHDFVEHELTESKEKEKMMAVEIRTLKEELSNLCENVSSLTGNSSAGESTTAAVAAVSRLAQELSEANAELDTLTQQIEQLKKEHSAVCDDLFIMKQSWSDCKSAMLDNPLSGINTLLTKLRSLQAHDCIEELLIIMQDVLIGIHSHSSVTANTLAQLVEKVTTSYSTVGGRGEDEADPLSMVTSMSKMLQSSIHETKQLEQRLNGTELEHSAALSGAITALKHDEDVRLRSKVESLREEEKMRYSHQLNELKHFWESEKKAALGELEAKTGAVIAELENLQQLYDAQLCDNKLLKNELAELNSKLHVEEQRRREELSTVEYQNKELTRQTLEEIAMYKEKSDQYALTIVALEKKLLELMDKCDSLQTDNVDLSEKLRVKYATCEKEDKGKAEKVKHMDQVVTALRKQVNLAAKDNVEKQSRISKLQEALKEVQIERKQYEEHLDSQHLAEVTDLRLMLSNQEATLECQKAEIDKLRRVISEKSSQSQQSTKKVLNECDNTKLKTVSHSSRLDNMDMCQVGQQCLGQKHNDIIAKQRGVITQLKQRICDLEAAKPPVGSHQSTLKELSRTRHELLKAKAEHASVVQQELPTADCSKSLLSYHVNSELQEESKLKETLRLSERSYNHLVNTICQNLHEVDKPDLNSEVNDRLLQQRKQFADSVSKQLKSIEQSTRRQHTDKGDVSLDCQDSQAEMITQLESLLSVTSEELEQQKRLNHALIKRKTLRDATD